MTAPTCDRKCGDDPVLYDAYMKAVSAYYAMPPPPPMVPYVPKPIPPTCDSKCMADPVSYDAWWKAYTMDCVCAGMCAGSDATDFINCLNKLWM